jgi:hypothetical protein
MSEPAPTEPGPSFTASFSLADYRHANWLMVRRHWLGWRMLRALALLTLIYWLLAVITASIEGGFRLSHVWSALVPAVALAAGVMAALALWFAWCVPYNSRKMYRELERLGIGCRYTFDANGLRAVWPGGTSDLRWQQLARWLENDRIFLIFITRRSFYVLPKEQIAPDTLNALRAQLIAAGISNR